MRALAFRVRSEARNCQRIGSGRRIIGFFSKTPTFYSLVREVDTPVGLAFLAMGYSGFDGSAPDAELVSVALPLCPAAAPIGRSPTIRAVETPAGLAFLAIGISGLPDSVADDGAVLSALIAPGSGVLISSSISLFLVD
jgi:hypothetical protein